MCACIPGMKETDRRIPRSWWTAGLVHWWVPGSVRDPALKVRWRATDEDTWLLVFGLYTCTHRDKCMCTHTHAHIHPYQCPHINADTRSCHTDQDIRILWRKEKPAVSRAFRKHSGGRGKRITQVWGQPGLCNELHISLDTVWDPASKQIKVQNNFQTPKLLVAPVRQWYS